MDAIRGVQEVFPRRCRGELNPGGGEGEGGPLHMKFSRDAAISRIPAPHLLKQGQLQLAGASFRDQLSPLQTSSGTGGIHPVSPELHTELASSFNFPAADRAITCKQETPCVYVLTKMHLQKHKLMPMVSTNMYNIHCSMSGVSFI